MTPEETRAVDYRVGLLARAKANRALLEALVVPEPVATARYDALYDKTRPLKAKGGGLWR